MNSPYSKYKDAGVVEAEVVMMRDHHKGSFLLLEGVDDIRFWHSRIAKGQCALIDANGKTNLVGAIRRLDQSKTIDAVGVVDDDCDRLRGVNHGSPNLVYTDERDLEGVLLRSSAFDKVLAEFGDPAKIVAFETHGVPVREALVARALPLGLLRWLAMNYGVRAEDIGLRPARFLDVSTWRFNEEAMLEAAGCHCDLPNRPELDTEYAQLTCADPWQVCRGHDLLQILGFGFERVLGHDNPGEKAIAKVLRSGIETHELQALQLYQDLKAWESRNPPYRVVQ